LGILTKPVEIHTFVNKPRSEYCRKMLFSDDTPAKGNYCWTQNG